MTTLLLTILLITNDHTVCIPQIIARTKSDNNPYTGIIISTTQPGKAHILTAYHPLTSAPDQITRIDVIFPKQHHIAIATILATDQQNDLLLLTIPNPGWLQAIKLATTEPTQAEPLYFGGYPQGGPFRWVNAQAKTTTNQWLIIHGNSIPGDSGGPIINKKGQLISLVSDGSYQEQATSGPRLNAIRSFLTKHNITQSQPPIGSTLPAPTE